jgi:drug/metabolite transporter (DMT)-like permease
MLQKNKNYLLLHFIVFIFGFTAILGKLITLPSEVLVWYRVFIGIAGIFFVLLLGKWSFAVNKNQLFQYLFVGVLIAIHWVTFFESVKQSNVSVALAAISSATLFTSLLEPIFFKRKFRNYEVVFGLLIIIGLFLIFNFETKYKLGLFLGIVSAFFASGFTVINGILVKKNNAKIISIYELMGAFTVLSIFLFFSSSISFSSLTLTFSNFFYLLVLGIVCTTFAFVASVNVMKELSPFTVSLTINLEPVYGIIIAYLLFGDSEKMTAGFYFGTVLILFTLFANAWFNKRNT